MEERRRTEAARIAEEEQKKAEAARIAEEEQKKAEAARITEEERRKAEAARITEQERQKAEAGRIAEEERRKVEAARIAEQERRKVEAAGIAEQERRKAEAARIADEERRKTEVARISVEERLEARLKSAKDAKQRTRTKRSDARASAAGACRNTAALEITGYKETRAELPSGAARQLASVANSLKGGQCRVTITGYGSIDMFVLLAADKVKPAIERMSMARAATVASELKRLGVAADQITTASTIGGSPRVRVTVQ